MIDFLNAEQLRQLCGVQDEFINIINYSNPFLKYQEFYLKLHFVVH